MPFVIIIIIEWFIKILFLMVMKPNCNNITIKKSTERKINNYTAIKFTDFTLIKVQ